MWDKLAECTSSTIDQFFTWKQTFFGPNSTSPLPPCNVVRKERLAEESPNIASGGKGGASDYCSNSGKRHCVPHILARIVDLVPWYCLPYGLVVRIPGFHPGGPGSIPGVGSNCAFILFSWCSFSFCSQLRMHLCREMKVMLGCAHVNTLPPGLPGVKTDAWSKS